jgi:KaiC/GvpD/RAD55 family RecA-like ATPase
MPLDRIEDWDEFLNPLQVQPTEPVKKLDRNIASKAAMDGDHWNNNIVRLVASWMAKGNTQEEIHILAQAHTLPDYTNEETRKEVQKMIDGAKNKGFAPSNVKKLRKPLLEHIANIELTAIKFLIHELIEEESLSQIFGDPGSGKSFLAIDAACSIGAGKDFHGHKVVQGPVIYIAGEGRRGVVRRINAWAITHSIKLADLPLYVSSKAVGINNGNNVTELKVEIDKIIEILGYPALIVLDTLARNFGGGDESDTKDMNVFIDECDILKDLFNCTVLIVHHSGHSVKGRARGSSVLYGALDSEYKITKSEDRIQMINTKMKDADIPEPMCFYLIPTIIGEDKNGDSIGSAVLEYRGEGITESARLTNSQKLGVSTFNEAAAQLVDTSLDFNPPQLHLDQWREAFYKRSTQPNPDSKRKAFDRARRDLQVKGWLTVEDDVYSLTPRTLGQSTDKQDLGMGPLD